MTKRLYTVTVEFDYAVLAENESDARRYASEAARDALYDADVHASLTVRDEKTIDWPSGYDESTLVYGTREDVTFGEAVAREKAAMEKKP